MVIFGQELLDQLGENGDADFPLVEQVLGLSTRRNSSWTFLACARNSSGT